MANLVGFSLGGLLAQKFVSLYSERVSRLVLLNCSLGSGNPDTVLPEKEVINMFLFFAALSREDCCRNAVDYHFGKSLEGEDPERYRTFYEYSVQNSSGISCQIPILASEEMFLDRTKVRDIPVMVVLSKDDLVTPPSNGQAFEKYLPRARIEYLDGHHASMLIHADKVTGLLKDFLSEGQRKV